MRSVSIKSAIGSMAEKKKERKIFPPRKQPESNLPSSPNNPPAGVSCFHHGLSRSVSREVRGAQAEVLVPFFDFFQEGFFSAVFWWVCFCWVCSGMGREERGGGE